MSTYKVKKGDGWHRIAKTTGVPLEQLLKLNGATANTMLHPDQVLKIKEEAPKPQPAQPAKTTSSANFGFGMGGTDYAVSALGSMYLNGNKQNNTEEPAKEQSNEPGFFSRAYDAITGFASSLGQTFGGQETAVQQLAQQQKQESDAAKQNLNRTGQAFYISYPEHKIGTKGTGFDFVGDTVPLVRGHAASIIVDDRGNATYHTYGRYNGDMGSYKTWSLPAMQKGENQEAYLKRIRKYLEYNEDPETKQAEPVKATHIPGIDHKKARAYYKEQPEKGNYSFFDGTTCAGEACRGIDAGIGQDSSRWYDWLIPDTPENVREHNYSNYKTYDF